MGAKFGAKLEFVVGFYGNQWAHIKQGFKKHTLVQSLLCLNWPGFLCKLMNKKSGTY